MNKINNTALSLLALCLVLFSSCDKFLDIRPTGKVIAETGEEYRALLTYEYKNFPEDRGLVTFRSDEFTLDKAITSTEDQSSFTDIWLWNDATPQATTASFGWRRYYHCIYIANTIIENKNKITNISTTDRNQLVGEAYMMRAYCHFLLANLYAEPYTKVKPDTARAIPLSVHADVNEVLQSSSLKAVYTQIESDIADAEKLINKEKWEEGYTYRFNKASVYALKARVELYKGNYNEALNAALKVIEAYPQLADLTVSSAELPNSSKSVANIMALEHVMTSTYVRAGKVSEALLSLYKAGDKRKSNYYNELTATTTIVRKGGGGDYRSTFRSAEFYLIVAEAEASLGQLDAAKTHLKALMQKRYTAAFYTRYATQLDALSKEELLKYIADERARELAFEGHRWFDLRRTSRPSMQKTYNGSTYKLNENDSRYTLRFPTDAVEANPNIVKMAQ